MCLAGGRDSLVHRGVLPGRLVLPGPRKTGRRSIWDVDMAARGKRCTGCGLGHLHRAHPDSLRDRGDSNGTHGLPLREASTEAPGGWPRWPTAGVPPNDDTLGGLLAPARDRVLPLEHDPGVWGWIPVHGRPVRGRRDPGGTVPYGRPSRFSRPHRRYDGTCGTLDVALRCRKNLPNLLAR